MGMEESNRDLKVLLTPEFISAWETTKSNILETCALFNIPKEASPLSFVEGMVRLAFYDGKMQGHRAALEGFKKDIREAAQRLENKQLQKESEE